MLEQLAKFPELSTIEINHIRLWRNTWDQLKSEQKFIDTKKLAIEALSKSKHKGPKKLILRYGGDEDGVDIIKIE